MKDILTTLWYLSFFFSIPLFISWFDNFALYLFVFYLVHGTLILRISLLIDKKIKDTDQIKETIHWILLYRELNKNIFIKIRFKINFYLKALIAIFNWPGFLLYQHLEWKRREFHDEISGKPKTIAGNLTSSLSPEPILAEIRFLSLISVYLFYAFFAEEKTYLQLFLYLFCAEILIRHLVYLLSPDNIFTQLRITEGNVFYRFFLIVLLDFLSVFLSAYGILKWGTKVPLNMESIFEVNKYLFNFSQLKEKIINLNLAVNDIFLFSVGFLILSMAKCIIRIKEFKRTDEDYKNLAKKYACAGKFKKSLNCIKKMKRIDDEQLLIASILSFGLYDINNAKRYAENYLNISNKNSDHNAVYRLIFSHSIYFPIHKTNFISLLKEAMVLPIDDVLLLTNIVFVLSSGVEADYLLLEYFTKKAQNQTTFPYSYCFLLILCGRIDRLGEVLKKMKFNTTIENILSCTYKLIIDIHNNEIANCFIEKKISSLFNKIESIINSLKKEEEQFIALMILTILIVYAKTIQFQTESKLKELCDRFLLESELNLMSVTDDKLYDIFLNLQKEFKIYSE
ncbi:MAG: hypothetical protein HQK72_10070 [Desulfamplus sp.]|nr:hypothetical protein [Desulfamplus sp.]